MQMKAGKTNTKELDDQGAKSQLSKWADWVGINTFNDPELELMVESVREFVLAIKNQEHPRWLSLIGNRGTGKTHCAKRVLKYAAAMPDFNNPSYAYFPTLVYWPKLADELRTKDSNGTVKFNDMMRWKYLALDDVFVERDTTGFIADKITTLLGCRVGKWTIITSNLTLKQIAAREMRIADRMIRDGSIVVDLQTQSYLTRKQQ